MQSRARGGRAATPDVVRARTRAAREGGGAREAVAAGAASRELQFVDDVELSARWVMSEGMVKSCGPAYCNHENLRDCVAAGAADTLEYVVMRVMCALG